MSTRPNEINPSRETHTAPTADGGAEDAPE